MPLMSAAFSCQVSLPLIEAYTPYPMIPAAMSTTTATTAIGPQLRPAVTGLIGLRPLPAGPFPTGREPGRAPPDLAGAVLLDLAGADLPDFAAAGLPAGGLPWPDFLSTLTVDGTRSGPGVLMLIAPRNQQVELKPSA